MFIIPQNYTFLVCEIGKKNFFWPTLNYDPDFERNKLYGDYSDFAGVSRVL